MTARAKRQRVSRPPAGKPGRPTPAAIRKDVTEGSLVNALLAYYGHPHEPITKLYDNGSVNKIACRLGVMAHDTPELGAVATIRELTERHQWFRDDEGPTSNIYDGETGFGRLFDLYGLAAGGQTEAAALVRQDLQRMQALYALLAVPGVVRNAAGQPVFTGPVVRAAGMRSLPSRVANPATTPVAAALLGGGTWHREPGPLEQAIAELAGELGFADSMERAQLGRLSNATILSEPALWDRLDSGVEVAQEMLAGCRTKHPYLIHRYADGSVFSALLGPIGASSTAQIRGAYAFGPEARDCETCHPFGSRERKVPASDARIEAGVLETWAQNSDTRWSKALPTAPPILTVRLGPGHDPEWSQP